MPRESRIASESVRQAVVALLMALMLVASLLLAWGQAGGPRVRQKTFMAVERVGAVSYLRPAGWEVRDYPTAGDAGVRGLVFQDPSRTDRRLEVLHTAFARPVPPEFAARRFFGALEDPALLTLEARAERRGPFASIVGLARTPRGLRMTRIATIDGMEYLAVNVVRDGRDPGQSDVVLMSLVWQSLEDARYQPLGARVALPVGISVDMPAAMGAWRRTDPGSGDLILLPTQDPRFATLRLSVVDLTRPPKWDATGDASEAPTTESLRRAEQTLGGLIESYDHQDHGARLLTWMLVEYHNAVHHLPPGRYYGQFQVLEESGHLLVVRNSAGSGYEALWGMTIGGSWGVLVDVNAAFDPEDATRSAVNESQNAAKLLIQSIAGSREPPVPQTPNPDARARP